MAPTRDGGKPRRPDLPKLRALTPQWSSSQERRHRHCACAFLASSFMGRKMYPWPGAGARTGIGCGKHRHCRGTGEPHLAHSAPASWSAASREGADALDPRSRPPIGRPTQHFDPSPQPLVSSVLHSALQESIFGPDAKWATSATSESTLKPPHRAVRPGSAHASALARAHVSASPHPGCHGFL